MVGVVMTGSPPAIALHDPMQVDDSGFSVFWGAPGMLTPPETPTNCKFWRPPLRSVTPSGSGDNSQRADAYASKRIFSPMDLDAPRSLDMRITAPSLAPDALWKTTELVENPLGRHHREHAHPGCTST